MRPAGLTLHQVPAPSWRGRVGRIARDVDRALGRLSSRRHVLVDVRTPMNAIVLRPMWRALLQDPRITVHFTAEDEASVATALGHDGLQSALISRHTAAWRRWHLAMTADPWNAAPLHRCERRIKFFHGVAGKYDLDDPHKLAGAGLDRYDRVAFINDDRRQRYLRAGILTDEQAVLVGYPKIDDLVNGTWTPGAVRTSLGLPPSTPTVLYAPTFSTASSLHAAGREIIATLLDCDVNVIVKLHDRSLQPHPKHTGGIDWKAELQPFSTHRRFRLVEAADATPFLAASDVLVTDHSTVGFEFALLDRPIVVFDVPDLKDAARIADDKWQLLRSMADVAGTVETLRAAVERALRFPERHQVERQHAHVLFAHAGSATERALSVIYELLQLNAVFQQDAPAPVAASTDSKARVS